MAHRVQVKQVVVSAEHAGCRLRNFLAYAFRDILLTRGDIISALRKKGVHVNGQITLDSHSLEEGDAVHVEVDMADFCKRRLKALDVEMKYREPGLVVLYKPPGVSRPDVEWAAPALLATADDGSSDMDLKPWMVVNEIEKGSQGLVVLVKNQTMHDAFLQRIHAGGVQFRFCAVCHGKVTQAPISNTAESLSLDKQVESLPTADASGHGLNSTGADGGCAPDADLLGRWLLYNHLPADIFDHVSVSVGSVTRSSGAGYLSMIKATVSHAAHGGLVLRRHMHNIGYPVVGGQKYALPLANHRDKGNLLALVGLEFASISDAERDVVISTDIPSKFVSVCEREVKFYERRQQKAQEEMGKLSGKQPPLADPSTVSDAQDDEVNLLDGKPAAYITGLKEFDGHIFKVSKDTLIPRPSTETLVAAAVQCLDNAKDSSRSPCILDLGTGSGCILCSVLLKSTGAFGVGIDISQPALDIAQANCRLHKLCERTALLQSSFETFTADADVVAAGPYDFIACNPPYISVTKAARMASTIGHEPPLALVAEDGGFQAYRGIYKSLTSNLSVLTSSGCIAFEIGKGMERGVRGIFKDWNEVGSFSDSHGFLRVLVFQRPAAQAAALDTKQE